VKTAETLLDLRCEDIMNPELVTIPRSTSLRDAARLLRRAQLSAAPVVDEQGRCVGMLSTADFLRWIEEGCPDPAAGPIRTCSFQREGRLLTGEEAVICKLAPGSCPLQSVQPTTDGRHTAVCLQPSTVLCDWQQVNEGLPEGGVAGRYMTTDIVTAEPQTPVAELARLMAESHSDRVFVLEGGRPVGFVCSAEILAGLAWGWPHSTEPTARP
jgi:CBS domain-containing protein